MLFQGTYDSGFYRQLHAVLHADHDLALQQAAAPSSPALAAEAAAVQQRWAELEAFAAANRMPAPTVLAEYEPVAPPDLSREFN